MKYLIALILSMFFWVSSLHSTTFEYGYNTNPKLFNLFTLGTISINNVDIDTKWLLNLSGTDSTILCGIIKNSNDELTVRIIYSITKLLGIPYKYGGQSVRGMDCSAFVRTVYKNALDYILPRTSGQQSKLGILVKSNDLQLGDLMFFSRGSRISHVAIFLTDGYYVHASRRYGKIRIQQFNKYQQKWYAYSKRMIYIDYENFFIK